MAASTLVVVAYLAGASWGPQVTLYDAPGMEACRAMQASVAQVMLKTAKANTTGGAVTLGDEGEDLVLEAGSGREVARLTCLGPSGRPGR
ncbi:hypothetical protein AVHM3334_19885 [Acidovorax sp. SUPP3334]|nr:hypothetical protein AVHM3334_19885 [Acidovorax sp. SUPP3334]